MAATSPRPAASHGYRFLDSSAFNVLRASSNSYRMIIRQQPRQAKVCMAKDKDRRPIDPPPIIQLKAVDAQDELTQNYLQNPYFIMYAALVSPATTATASEPEAVTASTIGSLVSSLHRLKDIDNSDGGFFVFPDISVKLEGKYRLRFCLYELVDSTVVYLGSEFSDVFTVYPAKKFPGMAESTFLSRSFSDQGVRIRIRKEHRLKFSRRACPQPHPSPLESTAVVGAASPPAKKVRISPSGGALNSSPSIHPAYYPLHTPTQSNTTYAPASAVHSDPPVMATASHTPPSVSLEPRHHRSPCSVQLASGSSGGAGDHSGISPPVLQPVQPFPHSYAAHSAPSPSQSVPVVRHASSTLPRANSQSPRLAFHSLPSTPHQAQTPGDYMAQTLAPTVLPPLHACVPRDTQAAPLPFKRLPPIQALRETTPENGASVGEGGRKWGSTAVGVESPPSLPQRSINFSSRRSSGSSGLPSFSTSFDTFLHRHSVLLTAHSQHHGPTAVSLQAVQPRSPSLQMTPGQQSSSPYLSQPHLGPRPDMHATGPPGTAVLPPGSYSYQ
ncbi:hypothetical protein H4R35_000395 [Dimargaris xerosporica]|nr:hypothetical protein H4R35_000395 [Dimargaris xerosporica]